MNKNLVYLCIILSLIVPASVYAADNTSNSIKVKAKISDPSVPGALICRDYDTVSLVIALYRNYAQENMRASIYGNERYKSMHGELPVSPKLNRYGCILIESDTNMIWDGNWMPPVVTVEIGKGKKFKGVTDPSMINNR